MFSGYNGRRGPNVSQYLNNLNAIPSPHDAQQPDLNLSDDGLDFLTNTQFVDFDAEFNQANGFANAPAHDLSRPHGENGARNYEFPDFPAYPSTTAAGVASPSDIQSPATSTIPGQQYPGDHFHTSPNSGDKRKSSLAPGATDLDDNSRAAAEEDKRRRNTAASARFRVKKKQREQALEKQAKEMTEKVQLLEGKVQALERENLWLKELITEKNGGKAAGSNAGVLERGKAADAVERSTESRTDGVGTSKSEAVPSEA